MPIQPITSAYNPLNPGPSLEKYFGPDNDDVISVVREHGIAIENVEGRCGGGFDPIFSELTSKAKLMYQVTGKANLRYSKATCKMTRDERFYDSTSGYTAAGHDLAKVIYGRIELCTDRYAMEAKIVISAMLQPESDAAKPRP